MALGRVAIALRPTHHLVVYEHFSAWLRAPLTYKRTASVTHAGIDAKRFQIDIPREWVFTVSDPKEVSTTTDTFIVR
jgi:hypothetical protein